MAYIGEVYQTLLDDDGWAQIADSDRVRTLYRHEAGAESISIKVHGFIPANAMDVLVVINEIDLLSTFLPLVEMQQLKQAPAFRQLVHARVKVPWPVWDRDCVLDARGWDMLDRGAIVIVARTASTPDALHSRDAAVGGSAWTGVNFPELAPKTVRLDARLAGGLVVPVRDDLTYVCCAANVDPKMAVVPMPLINFFTKQLAWYGFVAFRKQCMRFTGSLYEHRMRTREEEVYADVRARLKHRRKLGAAPVGK